MPKVLLDKCSVISCNCQSMQTGLTKAVNSTSFFNITIAISEPKFPNIS